MSDYPQWLNPRPIESWPRELTTSRVRSPFSAPWGSTAVLLKSELTALGDGRNAAHAVLQIAIAEADLRIDGRLRANVTPAHPGVILAIESRHGDLAYPCDKFTGWRDNVRAVALALESLRRVERYGITETGQQYTGWKAIESAAPKTATEVETAEALLRSYVDDNEKDPETVSLKSAYRTAVAITHPDRNKRADYRAEWNGVETAAQILKKAGKL